MSIQAYQVAFAEATSELRDIVEQFEKLRARKELIEKVVEALKPVVGFAGQVATIAPQSSGPFPPLSSAGFESSFVPAQSIRSFPNPDSN